MDGERLTDAQVVNFAAVLLVAGHITTTVLLGNTVLALDAYPDQLAKVRQDRALVPAAIEESLRFLTPFAAVARVTNKPEALAGLEIPADQMLLLWDVDYLAPGILVMTVGAGAAGTAVNLCTDMGEGIVARFRTMAISRYSVLAGQALSSVLNTVVSLALVIGVALLTGFRPTAGLTDWLAAAGLLVLLALAFTWLGIAFGLAAKTPGSPNCGRSWCCSATGPRCAIPIGCCGWCGAPPDDDGAPWSNACSISPQLGTSLWTTQSWLVSACAWVSSSSTDHWS